MSALLLFKVSKILNFFSGVGEAEWAFKTTLNATEAELAAPNVDLVFEGLDTFATVKLVSMIDTCTLCSIVLNYVY